MFGAALAITTVLATAAPTPAPRSVSLQYDVYVGDTTHPAVGGLIWLQRYGLNGVSLQRIGTIREGTASIEFNADIVPQLRHPDPRWDYHFVVAFELSGAQWYFSRPVDMMHFFSDVPAAIETIGKASDGGRDAPRAIGLAPSTTRTLTFENEDGTPAKGMRVGLAVHLNNANHCAVEQGPNLGYFRTDDSGVVSFESPPAPLTVGVRYYSDIRGEYFAEVELLVGSERDIVVRRTWTLPFQRVSLKVEDVSGKTVAGQWIEQRIRTHQCGVWSGRAGRTDPQGIAEMRIQPLSVDSMWVLLPGDKERLLTPLELHLLFSRGSLTIRI
ncbi:MAG TPA: hypothetical protein VKT51_01235 [Candidatus Eremiobacteraceae bacterium]|nr:hypothetical protein [Candidatus Eremiobacteraceae bacterium]